MFGLLSLAIGIVIGRLSKRNQIVKHVHTEEDPADYWKKGPKDEDDDEENQSG